MDAYIGVMTPYSLLDLAPIVAGGTVQQTLQNSRDLAQHAERLGYHRFWLAEHHNMPGVASAATAVMIAHVGQGTTTIRLGAGGIMLPNHAPLQIAEQFGTLDAMFPGRIDLGLGRAPGGDPLTAQALRRTLIGGEDRFPRDVLELQALLGPPSADQRVQAVPGSNSNVPLWILGSSTFGAQLAAMLGLPFAFASHFAPAQMDEALDLYRTRFKPSAQLSAPYVMLGFNVFAAPTDAEAQLLATSWKQAFVNLRRGMPSQLLPPRSNFDETIAPHERAGLDQMLSCSAIGSPETVEQQLKSFITRTGADELMLTALMFDHAARMQSFEIAAKVLTRRAT
jgi:luciferase family oxidoreductase group 1